MTWTWVYDKPRFERTIEISKEQYDRILEFSADPKKHGFDMNYDFFSNACTDFAWGALNHAGLRPVGLARRSPAMRALPGSWTTSAPSMPFRSR